MNLAGSTVLVVGAGVSGQSAVRAALAAGARVVLTAPGPSAGATELEALGAELRLGVSEPPPADLVVTSPGLKPDDPLLLLAAAQGTEVIGEVEFGWRLGQARPAPAAWLALTGTNGKTTTVRMLESILRAAGHHAVAAGNVGLPIVDAVTAEPPYDVLAVELSSFQLHWSSSVAPAASAVLNLAEDHLDWHGTMSHYAAAKARIWAGGVAIGNADDPRVAALLAEAPGRRVSFTLSPPADGQLGVRDGVLLDRAFGGTELARAADVRPAGPHNVANALAAAALARAYDVPADAVRAGLAAFTPDRHRNELVGVVREVSYVDDSKATNPHAADASLGSYDRVVWIAGGLLKGAGVDDLVAKHADRLAGAVLIGSDRGQIADAIARHAPGLPVADLSSTDDGSMVEAVRAAAGLARPGDVVLLAPCGASFDMFANYGARGDAFAAAVEELS